MILGETLISWQRDIDIGYQPRLWITVNQNNGIEYNRDMEGCNYGLP